MKKSFIAVVFSLILCQGPITFSQEAKSSTTTLTFQQQDSVFSAAPTRQEQKLHKSGVVKTMVVPALVIGYGLSSFGNNGFPYSSQEAFIDRNRYFPHFHTAIDDVTWAVPAVAVYALNAAGVKGKHKLADRSMLYLLSTALTNGVVAGIKESTNRVRPDLSTNNSFPSGHTANAFVSAEFLHQEYKEESIWYSVAGYSIATATGAMRILNNRHWLTDVCVGAGIGMLSTKTMYLLYPLIEQKLSAGKPSKNKVGILPSYNGQQVSIAIIYMPK